MFYSKFKHDLKILLISLLLNQAICRFVLKSVWGRDTSRATMAVPAREASRANTTTPVKSFSCESQQVSTATTSTALQPHQSKFPFVWLFVFISMSNLAIRLLVRIVRGQRK